MAWLRKNFPIVATVLVTALLFAVARFLPDSATGDSGDSILHYLYSHYAPKHPELFFDHWAKPLFVVFSAPFAAFGFKGIVVFNAVCVSLSALFTYYTAKKLELKYAELVFLIPLCAPLYFALTFSGLTEYLFSLLLSISLCLVVNQRYLACLIVASFLPLVRSEGLIICAVLGAYTLYLRKPALIPLLLTGQAIFSLIGLAHHDDLFWIWTKIPYASFDSPYGHGKALDFVFRLMYVIEKPLFLLLWTGVFFLSYGMATRKNVSPHLIVMVLLFLSFFFVHSLFWWLGIFNSMGLPRVLNAIMPLMVIIVLVGLGSVLDPVREKFRTPALIMITALIVVFPFTYRAKGIVYEREAFVVPEIRLLQDSLGPYIHQHFHHYQDNMFYYRHPGISLVMNHDYFNWQKHQYPGSLLSYQPEKGLLVWDNWFSKNEDGIELTWLLKNPHLVFKKSFVTYSKSGLYQFCVFEVK